jgi:methyl-accepting chemotaxis protein
MKNRTDNFIAKLKISHLIWASFGIVISALLVNNIIGMKSISNVFDTVEVTVEDVRLLTYSMQLNADIEKSARSLGFYLLGKEEYQARNFEQARDNTYETLQSFKALLSESSAEEIQSLIDDIENDINRFFAYQEKLFSLAENPQDNLPAMKFAAENVNPISQKILSNLSDMLFSEAEEDSSSERKILLNDINDLRYNWVRLMSGIRAFLAFRGKNSLDEISMYQDNLETISARINDNSELLTFEQEESLNNFETLRKDFNNRLKTLLELHGSESWRQDVYLTRNELSPILENINLYSTRLVEYLGNRASTARESARDTYNIAGRDSYTLLVTTTILILLAGWSLMRQIRTRLGTDAAELQKVAEAIASGDLKMDLNNDGKTATGVLASMQVMQANLRNQIEKDHAAAAENSRIRRALDKADANIMIADADYNIIYMNDAIQSMMKDVEEDIRTDIPEFDAAQLAGSSIDVFNTESSSKAHIFEQLTTTQVVNTTIGGRSFRIISNPIIDDHGQHLGTVAEWFDRTQEVGIEDEIKDIVTASLAGDLSQRISMAGKSGFYAMLSGGINELVDINESVINDTASVMGAMSNGDLTRCIESDYLGSFGQLKQDINATVAKLTQVLGDIGHSANAVLTGSNEIAHGNVDLSHRTEDQAISLVETSSTMDSMTSTVRQNAENARHADKLAASTRDQADQGGHVVEDAVTAMGEISTASKKIADIISVIDEIAFQTNLLALNAAVEAARAGEQGRGFAVVASEVRNLAGRSATAAREIKILIEDSVSKVEEGSRLVDKSGKTLGEIRDSAKKVSDIVADIAMASQEQSNSIEQVNQVIMRMDESTQQNAALVEQAAASSESMGEQARNLNELVGFFKTSSTRSISSSGHNERRTGVRPWAGQDTPSITVGNPDKAANGTDGGGWEEF